LPTSSAELWQLNFAKIVVVDVTDDYRFMQPPLPSDWYPVLREVWIPALDLDRRVPGLTLVDGYLYDWHQSPDEQGQPWYVGVVDQRLLHEPIGQG
jgi:hypothetical protein